MKKCYVGKILPTESSSLVIYVGICCMATPISKTEIISDSCKHFKNIFYYYSYIRNVKIVKFLKQRYVNKM